MRVDNFEGERVRVEDLSDKQLAEVRANTVEAIEHPQYAPASYWESQLEIIDEELEARI